MMLRPKVKSPSRKSTLKRASSSKTRETVKVSNTAANMLVSMYGNSDTAKRKALRAISRDIGKPSLVRKVDGYNDTFFVNSNGKRVLFKTINGSPVITAISYDV